MPELLAGVRRNSRRSTKSAYSRVEPSHPPPSPRLTRFAASTVQADGYGTPSGWVDFYDALNYVGMASLDASGQVWAGTGNPDTSIHSRKGLADGKWHHVVLTRKASTGALTLFVDGMQVGAGNDTEVQVFQGQVDLYEPDTERVAAKPRVLTTGQANAARKKQVAISTSSTTTSRN